MFAFVGLRKRFCMWDVLRGDGRFKFLVLHYEHITATAAGFHAMCVTYFCGNGIFRIA